MKVNGTDISEETQRGLLDDDDPALQRKNKLALVEFGAVIVANARDVFAVVLTR